MKIFSIEPNVDESTHRQALTVDLDAMATLFEKLISHIRQEIIYGLVSL